MLRALGFRESASYSKKAGRVRCAVMKRHGAGEKTYLLTTASGGKIQVLYVGETKTAGRMYQYHNNRVMRTVRAGLRRTVRSGGKVDVWVCRNFGRKSIVLAKGKFSIGRLGLEGILIDHFHPPWNRKKGLRVG